MDWLTAVLTGFFTGVGVTTANWFHDRHLRERLDRLSGKKKELEDGFNK